MNAKPYSLDELAIFAAFVLRCPEKRENISDFLFNQVQVRKEEIAAIERLAAEVNKMTWPVDNAGLAS